MNTLHHHIHHAMPAGRTSAVALLLALSMSATAQIPGSALDYMLQRPRVAKYYPHKHLFDHLFLDAGTGINMVGVRHPDRVGAYGEMNIGDWISPEHGFRLSMNVGILHTPDAKAKYAGLGLDYMLNITALAQPGTFYRPKPFEVYGIAGLDFAYSRNKGHSDLGYGAHIALRGQVALSRSTYFYIEPRAGLLLDDVPQAYTWHGYRPVASASVGFGYRLPERGYRVAYTDSLALPSAANGLFVSMAGGPTFVASAHPSVWRHNAGARLTLGIGKWFDSYQALRLGVNATTFRQNSSNRVKAAGVQVDYLFNLHSLFAGVNPYRPFWINGVLGTSFNHTTDNTDTRHHNVWGVGAGLQANLRLSQAFALTLEPRLDVYGKYYAPHTSSYKNYDAMPSLLAGITYTYHRRQTAAHVKDNTGAMPYNTVGIYGGVANRLSTLSNHRAYMPLGRISYTHWYGANAWRLSLQGMMQRQISRKRFAQASLGADWMTDLTAHSYGYDPLRTVSVALLAGANAGVDYSHGSSRFAPDVHGGAQMRIRLGGAVSMVGEAQLAYMLGPRLDGHRNRTMPQAMIGLEYNMQQNGRRHADTGNRPQQRNMLTIGAGTGLYTANFTSMSPFGRKLSMVTALGYGHWFNTTSGIYGQVATTVTQRHGKGNQAITSIRAGYMLNMKEAALDMPTQQDVFQLTGILAPAVGIATRKDHDTKVAPGIHAAMQAGWRIGKNIELFVEPSATVYSNRIEYSRTGHPAEGELNLSVGTKVHF